MKRKFNTVEETQCWVKFTHNNVVYDLSHLDAHQVSYDTPGQNYNFIVTYSFHVFAKNSKNLSDLEHAELMFNARKESRPFNHERYHLSLQLPAIIENLAHQDTLCFHAERGSFATCKLFTSDGVEVNYKIAFKVFREKRKLRIHVTTAFPLDEEIGRVRKVKFLTIAKSTLRNKEVRVPK